MAGGFLADVLRIGVVDDPLRPRQGDEALAPGPADQRQIGLAGKIDPPGGKAGTRNQDRHPHLHRLDDHLAGQPPGGVEDLVLGRDPLEEHVTGDLVHGVVPADVLHVDQRLILPAQHRAVNRPGLEIEAGRGVDLPGQAIEPRGPEPGVLRQLDVIEFLHHIAEHRSLGAARGPDLLLQLFLVVGLALGAHDDDLELVVVIDAGDLVVREQHVLVQQKAQRQVFGIIADGHHGDDFLAVEEKREGALDHHRGLDRLAVMVDALDRLGETGIVGVRLEQEISHLPNLIRRPRRGRSSPRARRRT